MLNTELLLLREEREGIPHNQTCGYMYLEEKTCQALRKKQFTFLEEELRN